MNKINKLIKCFVLVFAVLVVLICITSIFAYKKGVAVDNTITEFKNRSEYVGIYTIKTNKKEYVVSYYRVAKKHDYEINNTSRIYSDSYTNDDTQIYTDIYIGDVGDMYLSTSNPFGLLYTRWLSKKIYIGHSAIVSNENGLKTFESTGKDETGVHELNNEWFDVDVDNFIVLRSKSNINKKEMVEWLKSKENLKYNYLYFINNKKAFYCTDLISQCYQESNDITITNNKTMITGESIINNSNNYIIYYKEKSTKNGIDYNVYFLE